MKKYDLILADPPWQYSNKSSNGAADNHYNTTDFYSLTRLPIEKIASENSVLCMWYTGNFVREAYELAEAWRFKVRTGFGFVWVKLNKNAAGRIDAKPPEDMFDFMDTLNAETRINGGNYTRANAEVCLIGTRAGGWSASRPASGRLCIPASVSTARNRRKYITGWKSYMAMSRASNCLPGRNTANGMCTGIRCREALSYDTTGSRERTQTNSKGMPEGINAVYI